MRETGRNSENDGRERQGEGERERERERARKDNTLKRLSTCPLAVLDLEPQGLSKQYSLQHHQVKDFFLF